jgi:hypothetical protein
MRFLNKTSPLELVDVIPCRHDGRQNWMMFHQGLLQIERSIADAAESSCSSTDRSMEDVIPQSGQTNQPDSCIDLKTEHFNEVQPHRYDITSKEGEKIMKFNSRPFILSI